jgi:hypothetical protein
MHQKQPPAKVAFSNLCSETFPFVESPEALAAIISIIPNVKIIDLSMTIPPSAFLRPWEEEVVLTVSMIHGKSVRSKIPLTILMAHRYMKTRAEKKRRRVYLGSDTEELS